ncbi:MAG TPA: hypothetical protein VNA69_12800 [Thermoanaerobaculia bacterium]|nr:hypothetical protein [Thermoanaerobaculia bacterium]
MAGQTWTIMIKGSPASFDPDHFGYAPGEPLRAQIGDLVSWNNQTSDVHQIAVKKSDGSTSFTTKEIEGFKSSSPGYITASGDNNAGTINYTCLKHTGENGKITVVS